MSASSSSCLALGGDGQFLALGTDHLATNGTNLYICNGSIKGATNIEATNLKAIDGTSCITLTNSTGQISVNNRQLQNLFEIYGNDGTIYCKSHFNANGYNSNFYETVSTNLKATELKAYDGTTSMTISNSTGNVSFNSKDITSCNQISTNKIQLGSKWILSGNGDPVGDDTWCRLLIPSTSTYGDFACGKLNVNEISNEVSWATHLNISGKDINSCNRISVDYINGCSQDVKFYNPGNGYCNLNMSGYNIYSVGTLDFGTNNLSVSGSTITLGGAGTTITVSKNTTFGANSITAGSATINGTISGVSTLTATTINPTTINAFSLGGNITGNSNLITGLTTLISTNLRATNIKAYDNTVCMSIEDTTGNLSLNSKNLSSVGTLTATTINPTTINAFTCGGNVNVNNKNLDNVYIIKSQSNSTAMIQNKDTQTTLFTVADGVGQDMVFGTNINMNTRNITGLTNVTGSGTFTCYISNQQSSCCAMVQNKDVGTTAFTIANGVGQPIVLGTHITGNNKNISGVNTLDFGTNNLSISGSTITLGGAGTTIVIGKNMAMSSGTTLSTYTLSAPTGSEITVNKDLSMTSNVVKASRIDSGVIASTGSIHNITTGATSMTFNVPVNAFTLNGAVTGNSQNITGLGTLGATTINAFTLGGAITGNSQNITGLGTLTATTINTFTAGGDITMNNNKVLGAMHLQSNWLYGTAQDLQFWNGATYPHLNMGYNDIYWCSHMALGMGHQSLYLLQLNGDSAVKPTTNTWTITSDKRIKKDITDADLDICYNNVKNLKLKRYGWKYYTEKQTGGDNHQLGWIADDVEPFYPKAVHKSEFITKDEEKDNNGKIIKEKETIPDCKYLQADQIIKAMYGTIQKLQKIVEDQNERITMLEDILLKK